MEPFEQALKVIAGVMRDGVAYNLVVRGDSWFAIVCACSSVPLCSASRPRG